MIQIPKHFDQIRGSIFCAKHGPIQIDLHFSLTLRTGRGEVLIHYAVIIDSWGGANSLRRNYRLVPRKSSLMLYPHPRPLRRFTWYFWKYSDPHRDQTIYKSDAQLPCDNMLTKKHIFLVTFRPAPVHMLPLAPSILYTIIRVWDMSVV